jgi:hypothetical protein
MPMGLDKYIDQYIYQDTDRFLIIALIYKQISCIKGLSIVFKEIIDTAPSPIFL